MYNWYKNHMENPRQQPPPKKESLLDSIKNLYFFAKEGVLILLRAIKSPKGIKFMIIYALIAAVFITIAVVNYRSATRFNFMGTQMQILSAQHSVLTMSYPNGDIITARILGHNQFTVYYQDKTFRITRGSADSSGTYVIFSDGRTEIFPLFRINPTPNTPLIPGLTERQNVELYLLMSVRRLYSNFIPTHIFVRCTIAVLAMSFIGSLFVFLGLMFFGSHEEPPPDWNETYAILSTFKIIVLLGAFLIVLAFGLVTNMSHFA